MSTNPLKQVSQRKQVKSISEKVEFLAEAFEQFQEIIPNVNEAFQRTDRQMGELALIVEALVELFGGQVVDTKIKEIQERKAQEGLEKAQANLKAGLERGDLVVASVVGEKSLIVGRESDAQGNVAAPGKAQLIFSQIKPEFAAKLLGQAPGFVMETNGGKFEVLEVYDIVEKTETPVETPAPTAPTAEA